MTLWAHVIPFGNSSWTFPLAISIAIVLLLAGYRASALRWLVSFTASITVIIAGKLAFDLGGWCLPSIGLYSISGHAMQTMAIYPLLFMMMGSMLNTRAARWGFYLGVAVALFMAVTLVAGNYHTLSETVAGITVGLAVVHTYWRWKPHLGAINSALLIGLPICFYELTDWHGAVNPAKHAIWRGVAHWLGVTEYYSRWIYPNPNGIGRAVLVIKGHI